MTPEPDAPLTLDELAAALAAIGGFESRPRVAVAVSGGPDSLALMLLADRWARRRGGLAVGLTVDHGLRPGSAGEAAGVAGWLGARGIPHHVLAWTGAKPTSGIQEAAREARYGLLAAWCRDNAVLHLLAAHHREDQAETCLIRRRAGSGRDGLAGMATVRELGGCRLVRPLLEVPRARLEAFLRAEGQAFLRDPSNTDPAFERARLRLAAASRDPCGEPAVAAVLAEARACAGHRIAAERALALLLGRAAALHPGGFAALDAAALADAEPDLLERLLMRVAAAIGAMRYPVRRERAARLRRELASAAPRPRTLGGCRFVPWRGRVLVLRELAAAASPLALEPGLTVPWDGRFVVSVPDGAPSRFTLGYLGQSGAGLPPYWDSEVPRLAWHALPAVWDRDGLAALPHLGFRRPDASVLPCVLFRPARPLAQAGFTVV